MAKNFEIRREMNKDIVYGSLLELAKNKRVWYNSTYPEHSHFTDDGKDAILHVLENMFRSLSAIEKDEIDTAAKKQTLDALK